MPCSSGQPRQVADRNCEAQETLSRQRPNGRWLRTQVSCASQRVDALRRLTRRPRSHASRSLTARSGEARRFAAGVPGESVARQSRYRGSTWNTPQSRNRRRRDGAFLDELMDTGINDLHGKGCLNSARELTRSPRSQPQRLASRVLDCQRREYVDPDPIEFAADSKPRLPTPHHGLESRVRKDRPRPRRKYASRRLVLPDPLGPLDQRELWDRARRSTVSKQRKS